MRTHPIVNREPLDSLKGNNLIPSHLLRKISQVKVSLSGTSQFGTNCPSCFDATVGPFHSLTQGLRPPEKVQGHTKPLSPACCWPGSGQHDSLVSDLLLVQGFSFSPESLLLITASGLSVPFDLTSAGVMASCIFSP